MKKNMGVIIISFIILLFTMINLASAAGKGTSGALTLRYPVGGRAIGMGEAFVAVADDTSAIYWNPAGLTFLSQKELLFFYLEGLTDTNYGFVGFAGPTNIGTLGVSIASLQGGKAEIYSLTEPTREVTAQTDYVGSLSYANRLAGVLSAGVNIKIIQSELGEAEKASAYAYDIGMLYETPLENLFLGAVAQNMGDKIKYIDEEDPLPMTTKVGLAYTIFMETRSDVEEGEIESLFAKSKAEPESIPVIHNITIAVDAEKPNDDDYRTNIGLEYWYADTFALRTGYKLGRDTESFSAGLGWGYGGVEFDYAYAPVKDLESNHRVSLIIKF